MTLSYQVRLRAVFLALVTFVVASSSLMAQWSSLPALPRQVINTQQAVVGNKFYVFGGMDAASATVAEAFFLDLDAQELGWQQIASLPETRALGYAAAANGKIYLVGGVGVDGGVAGRATVLEYDPATDSYTPKASAPVAAWYGAGAISGTKIYYIGGLARVANANTGIQATQIYDIPTNTWSSGPNLPNISYYGSAAAVGNDVFYFGGRIQNATGTFYSGNTYKMTTGSGSWAAVPGSMNKMVEQASAGAYDGKIYVAGGSSTGTTVATTQVFDPIAGTWAAYYPMEAASAAGGSLAVGDDGLYYAGGSSLRPAKLEIGEPAAVIFISANGVNIAAKAGSSGARSFAIANLGVMNLTGTIEVAPDAPWLTTSAGAINIAPGAGESIELTADAATLTPGVHATTLTIRSNDAENPVKTLAVRVYVAADLVEQPTVVLLEEATGSWCGPCGAAGTPEVRRLKATYGESLITIAYHDRGGSRQDPMYTTQTELINNKLGVSAFPTAAVNRITWSGNSAPAASLNQWEPAIQTVLANTPNAPMALEVVEYNYNAGTKRVTAKVKLTSADAIDLSGKSVRLTAVVLEDSLQYSQYQGTENPYYHMDVARTFWPNVDGQPVNLPSGATDGFSVLMPNTEVVVDVNFTATGVTKPAKGHVVWILSVNEGAKLGMVLQSQENDLTASIIPGGGGSQTIAVTPDAAVKNIGVGQTAVFNTTVANLTDAPMEITVDRIANTLPSGEWSSQLCVGNGDACEPITTNRVTTTVLPGQTANFRVNVVGGTANAQGIVSLRISAGDTSVTTTYTVNTSTSGVDAETGSDAFFAVSAYPNPVIDLTRIEFTVPTVSTVSLDLFSATGEKVMSVLNARREAGAHSVNVDLSSMPAGSYSLVMTSGGRTTARTITVVR